MTFNNVSQAIQELLRCQDIEVAELALELLFIICIPSSSTSDLERSDDWTDAPIEVPDSLATDILLVFQGLSLLSTEFGLTDYLHGHTPPFFDIGAETITVSFPARSVLDSSTSDGTISREGVVLSLRSHLGDRAATDSTKAFSDFLQELQTLRTEHALSSDLRLRCDDAGPD